MKRFCSINIITWNGTENGIFHEDFKHYFNTLIPEYNLKDTLTFFLKETWTLRMCKLDIQN